MVLVEKIVFVVLRHTRGKSDVIAVFTDPKHANKFIELISVSKPGTYCQQPSTLWDFAPSLGEI